ncbi:MAG: hypothetical protein PUA75_06655 [Clostridiales bacterium]|nr:hypothetical protein [Clostridiales bacterium]
MEEINPNSEKVSRAHISDRRQRGCPDYFFASAHYQGRKAMMSSGLQNDENHFFETKNNKVLKVNTGIR